MTVPAKPILFCSHVVELGGAEMVLLDLLESLDRSRFRPHLCVPPSPAEAGSPLAQRARELDVQVHELPLGGSTKWQKALAALRGARALRQLAAKLQCNLVVANSMIAGYAAVRAQHAALACIWHLHIVTDSRLARAGLSRAAAVIAPSHAGLECARVSTGHVIPNGVPERFFASAEGVPAPQWRAQPWRAQHGIPAAAPLVGIVGRLDSRKGHEVLLRALADWPSEGPASGGPPSAPPPHLAIAGSVLFADSQRRLTGHAESLRQAAEQPSLQGRVHWLGEIADTAPLLRQLDALIVPSTGLESAPRTIAEAQASGCPVVASDLGGIPEMLEDGRAGMLVPPDNAPALQQAVRELLDDPKGRDERVRAGRERAGRYYRVASFARACEQVFTSCG